ncbi:mitochondrial-processing peptidase subunit alpha-like [Babylonia areolata]|uniref:mitochondrial-processing peptidase subunit alpha-like n=1 Tax=Babylonia areolata TaxID=304850 RepID=UPI003FD48119
MATRIVGRMVQQGCRRFSRNSTKRQFCSGSAGEGDITSVSLSQPVSWIPAPKYAVPGDLSSDTHVTVLDNGLRVASENKFGQFCTVGVLIDSGSRYEVAYPSGVSHFLEKLAFGITSGYKSRDLILQKLEKHGGICDSQGSRDTLVYAASAETHGIDSVMDILSDVVLRPLITPEEMEDARMAISFELESLNLRPDPEPLLMELIHSAAYRDNTLGLPKTCPEENVSRISQQTLYQFMKSIHTPQRMVVAGVGVEHQCLVDLCQKYFLRNKSAIWEERAELVGGEAKPVDKSVSQYTGGIITVEKDLSNVSLGPTPMPELAHLVVGLESCSHRDPDFIAFCVLNMMMGGGGSFSAGGPGKGMYTRLYLNVLNKYHWMFNATAYNHAYEDSGLFCIHASAHPSKLRELTEVVLRELVYTAGIVYPDELARAKRQLQSMLMMNLESRPVVFEDIGRQVLASGKRHQPSYYYDEIGKITESDIQRVANRMLKSKPAVAAYGTLEQLPRYSDVEAALCNKNGRMPRRFQLFR